MSKDVIDMEEFLERVQDDKDLILELFDIFLEDFYEKRESLAQAIANNDCDRVRSVAHSMKGASGNISAKGMHKITMDLEQMGKKGQLDGAQELLAEIDQSFVQLKARIEALKTELT